MGNKVLYSINNRDRFTNKKNNNDRDQFKKFVQLQLTRGFTN